MSEFQLPKEEKAIVLNKDAKPEITTIQTIEPTDDSIVIKSKAFALNPTDWKHISWMKVVGAIVGSDVSGTVVKVGKNVKGFEIGDNVSTFIHGSFRPLPYPAAFSEYVNASPLTTYKYNYELTFSKDSKVPAGKIDTWEGAASLTLSLVTIGLSYYYSLGLDKSKDYSNESILIWSGATAAGSVAIQVAKWLGFKNIIVTASKNRWDFLKDLGATALFDYKDKDVVEQIKKQFGEDIVYGFDTFSIPETYSNCYLALSDTKPISIDNLLGLTEKDLTVPVKQQKVKIGNTLAYLANGEDINFFGNDLKATKELVESHVRFHKDVQPLLDEQKIKHIPLHILDGGFEGLIEGLKILESGDYGNEKFVARL